MNITIKIVCENPDGSADAEVDYDEEGLKVLVQYGIIAMLIEGMENTKTKLELFPKETTYKKKGKL